jgi:hypothetical protein
LHRRFLNREKLNHAKARDVDGRADVCALTCHRCDIDPAMAAENEIGRAQRESISHDIVSFCVNDNLTLFVRNIDRADAAAEIALTCSDAKLLRRLSRLKGRFQFPAMALAGIEHAQFLSPLS